MSMIRFFPAVLLAALVSLGASAQDPCRDRTDPEAGIGGSAHVYVGKILKLNTEKRNLVLDGRLDITRKGKMPPDPGKVGTRTLTFTIDGKARFKVDGKEANMGDLKPGQHARVYTDRGGPTPPTGTVRPRPGTGSTLGPTMTTSRIDAFSEPPAESASSEGSTGKKKDR